MKPVKVIHIVNVDRENYYLNNLIDFTDSKKIEFSFITFAPSDCEFASCIKKRGKTIYALNALRRNRYPQAFKQIRSILRTEEPDIVHTHLFDPTVIGLASARREKLKTVFTRHHSDALYQINSSIKRKFYLKLENYVNTRADHIIAPSQMVRDIMVEKENVPAEKISLIPYGQTTERFDAVTPEKIACVQSEFNMKRNLALVFVARLFYRKGHIYLFQAFAELIKNGLDATLYLVGSGDYRTELEQFTKQLQIKSGY